MQNVLGHRSTLYRFRRRLRRLLHPHANEPRISFEDLAYAAGSSLRIDELLIKIPEQICAAFHLQTFTILLRQDSFYVQQGRNLVAPVALPASAAVIAKLKRDRQLLLLNKPEPDGWRLLSDPRDLDQLNRLHAQVLLPLTGRTGLMGFAALAAKGGANVLLARAHKLEELASQIGLGLETAQFQHSLQDEATRRERIMQSLELAREVQKRLLPQTLPATPGLDTAAIYRSAEQVGGDYYDAFQTGSGMLAYVIADVSGKGTPAALLMAALRASIRTAILHEPSLPDLLRVVNAQLYSASSSARYATLAMLLYDPATGAIASCNAGHNSPLLLTPNGVRELSMGGPVLGLLPEVTLEQEQFTLAPGDTLVLYTDGVTEWTDEAGEEWGREGILRALEAAPQTSAQARVDHVVTTLHHFAGRSPQTDDVTLLVLTARDPDPTSRCHPDHESAP